MILPDLLWILERGRLVEIFVERGGESMVERGVRSAD